MGIDMSKEILEIQDNPIDIISDALCIKDQHNWLKNYDSIFNNIIGELNLPDNSLRIYENKSKKDKEKTISYSICVYEPEYPASKKEDITRRTIIFNVKQIGKTNDSSFKITISDNLFFEIMEIQQHNILNNTVNVIFKDVDGLITFSERAIRIFLNKYVSKSQPFGCCDKYIECSNARECVHINRLYSKACMYRKNLEEGRIFYGENKNV